MPSILALIFDHDGTLVDSERSHWQSWNKTLAAYGTEITETQYKAHCAGRSTLDTARYIKNNLLPDLTTKGLYDIQRQARDADPGHAHDLLPCADEMVRDLAKSYPIAIATGAERYSIDQTLQAYSWGHLFSAIATSSDVANPKPAPDVYLKAAEGLGVDAKNCLAIEDSEPGYQSAMAAGCHTILVESDFSPQAWAPADTPRIANLCELKNYLESLSH